MWRFKTRSICNDYRLINVVVVVVVGGGGGVVVVGVVVVVVVGGGGGGGVVGVVLYIISSKRVTKSKLDKYMCNFITTRLSRRQWVI